MLEAEIAKSTNSSASGALVLPRHARRGKLEDSQEQERLRLQYEYCDLVVYKVSPAHAFPATYPMLDDAETAAGAGAEEEGGASAGGAGVGVGVGGDDGTTRSMLGKVQSSICKP